MGSMMKCYHLVSILLITMNEGDIAKDSEMADLLIVFTEFLHYQVLHCYLRLIQLLGCAI